MVFYKGALSFETLNAMPLDRVIELNEDAERIIKEAKKNQGN
jgi:hypothetical protein